MKNLTTHVPNYTQIYFPYSTVTSVTYMQKRFRHQNKPFYISIGMK